MNLGQLIERLSQEDPAKPVRFGFGIPHSYRGYYADLAFEPVENTTVGAMLESARSAMGKTFTGYKGGEYDMGEFTTCWLANYGDCGEGIGPVLLSYMLSKTDEREKEALRAEVEKLKLVLIGIWFESPWAKGQTGDELREMGERYGRYQEDLCKGIRELVDAIEDENFGSSLEPSARLQRAVVEAERAYDATS